MEKLGEEILHPKAIKLAPMECASSCIMTYLSYKGYDYKYYLLSYWNINYFAHVLMSGKNIRRNHLDYLYGIQTTLQSGDKNSIQRLLNEGTSLLLKCKASALSYFPRELLNFEDSQLEHFILMYGYDQHKRKYLVVDPISDYVGTLSEEDLEKVSEHQKMLYYYVFEDQDPSFIQPSHKELFRNTALHNYNTFSRSMHCEGDKAFTLFQNAVHEAVSWPEAKRNHWVDQNNITISTITKTRAAIWNSYCDLNVMTPEQMEAQGELFNHLVKRWTSLNLALMKFKRRPQDESIITSIQRQVQYLREHEYLFLKQLKEIEV